MKDPEVNYAIISSDSLLELTVLVNQAITSGFLPSGGMAVDNGHSMYLQAIIRKRALVK
jgi:hypothetical protein